MCVYSLYYLLSERKKKNTSIFTCLHHLHPLFLTDFSTSIQSWLCFFSLIPWERMQPAAAALVLACRTGRWLYFWEISGHVSLLRNVGGHKPLFEYNEKSKEEASGGGINFWRRQNCKVNHSCSSSRHCRSLFYLFSELFSINKNI